jgi:radical SAM superfamily enzyme YgiQ (UPF0313 family)
MMQESHYHGHGVAEPIGLEYIAANLAVKGFTSLFRTRNELVVLNEHSGAAISLLSGITSDFTYLIESARTAKSNGLITAIGGYHACGHPSDFTSDLFDYVIIGEGEEVAIAIAEAELFNKPLDIECLNMDSESTPRVLRTSQILNVDALPNPLRSQERLAPYMVHDLMWPPASHQFNTALVLGSRGCAHSCSFCASATVWGQGIRFRSPEKIVTELSDLKTNYDTNTIVFIDQSMGQAKQWSLDLCAAIRNANLDINWYHQSNLSIDRTVINAMAAAGCKKIGFGVEGLSPQAISKLKPMNSTDFEFINSLFDYCNSLGLFVKAYLMIGFPWETEDIINEYFEWLPKIRANQIKISYFTPFPGTRDWARFKNQLITSNWVDFDTVRMPVVHNSNISVERYHEIRVALFRSFYGSHTYADLTRQMLRAHPHYVDSYREFADYLHQFNMVSGDAPWLEWVRYGQGSKVSVAAGR